MPCQVSGHAVATNSLKLEQASGTVGTAKAGLAAGSARATHAIALNTIKARTEFFTDTLFPEMPNRIRCSNALHRTIYSKFRKAQGRIGSKLADRPCEGGELQDDHVGVSAFAMMC